MITIPLQDADEAALFFEAGQAAAPAPIHYYVGLDFQPVEAGLPDDDIAVFVMVSDSEDDPVFIGFRDGGFWLYSDGSPVGSTRDNRVTHWAHKPDFCRIRPSQRIEAERRAGVDSFITHLSDQGLVISDLAPFDLPAAEESRT